MSRFLKTWLLTTVLGLLFVMGFNLVVDPYGVFRLFELSGFNHHKPRAATQVHAAKRHGLERVQPRGLILGNSRADIGLDPRHPAWPPSARPVYNLAVPGAGMGAAYRYLKQAFEQGSPRLVVLGLDFMDFPHPLAPKPEDYTGPQGLVEAAPPQQSWRQRLEEQFTLLLSLSATLDSFYTVAAQRLPETADMTALGFNPLREYAGYVRTEGHYALFRQRDLENFKNQLRYPANLYFADAAGSPSIDTLRALIRDCQQRNIELRLYIHPYHAHLNESLIAAGLWPTFENWKREIARIVAQEGQGKVPLWDFSGYNTITTEPVPKQGDTKTRMQWYWESGHYKKAVGDMILDRVLGHGEPSRPIPEDFGARLDTGTLEAHLRRIQAARNTYLHRAGQEIDALAQAFLALSKERS